MVWGAINTNFCSQLDILNGTLTDKRYVDTILLPVLIHVLSMQQHNEGNRLIFQQDNALTDIAGLTQNFLQTSVINVLDWLAMSTGI